jgi:hypothetical protein
LRRSRLIVFRYVSSIVCAAVKQGDYLSDLPSFMRRRPQGRAVYVSPTVAPAVTCRSGRARRAGPAACDLQDLVDQGRRVYHRDFAASLPGVGLAQDQRPDAGGVEEGQAADIHLDVCRLVPANESGEELLRDVVVVGGSAGALKALRQLVACLPADLPAAVLVSTHLAPSATSRSRVRRYAGRLWPPCPAPSCFPRSSWRRGRATTRDTSVIVPPPPTSAAPPGCSKSSWSPRGPSVFAYGESRTDSKAG